MQGNDGILEGGIIQASGRPEDSDSGSGDSEDYVDETAEAQARKMMQLPGEDFIALTAYKFLPFCFSNFNFHLRFSI